MIEITSLKFLKVKIGRIGPKISSLIKGDDNEGFRTRVGEIFVGFSYP
jgi:hypothetical protein